MNEISITHPTAGTEIFSSTNAISKMKLDLKHRYGKMFFKCEVKVINDDSLAKGFRIKDKLNGQIYTSMQQAKKETGLNHWDIFNDARGNKKRFEKL